jgi:hypothetical protein
MRRFFLEEIDESLVDVILGLNIVHPPKREAGWGMEAIFITSSSTLRARSSSIQGLARAASSRKERRGKADEGCPADPL